MHVWLLYITTTHNLKQIIGIIEYSKNKYTIKILFKNNTTKVCSIQVAIESTMDWIQKSFEKSLVHTNMIIW